MVTVLLLVGEITPKTHAKHNAERIAVRFAGTLHLFMVVLYPISFVFMKASKAISQRASKH